MTVRMWEWDKDNVSWLWVLPRVLLRDNFTAVMTVLGDFATVTTATVERRTEECETYALPTQLEEFRQRLLRGSDVRHVFAQLDLHCIDHEGTAFDIEGGGRLTLFAADPVGSPDPMVDLALNVDVYDPHAATDPDAELAIANGPRLSQFLRRLGSHAIRLDSVETDRCPNAFEFGIRIPWEEL